MLTNEMLMTTYEALKDAVGQAFRASEAAGLAKEVFETARGALMLEGRLDGKNEAQREAQAREMLADLYSSLTAAEKAARVTKNAMDLARLDVELVRAQLRLMELSEATAE